jgi:thiol-disulfide isomerase/thioredoxin
MTGCSANAGASTADNVNRFPASDQKPVGQVAGRTLEGGHIDLADLKGHVVVVDFWSSTCAPCIAEQQSLNEVAKAERAKGVRFVGIDERDDASQARAYLAQHPASYPSLFDPDGMMTLQFPGAAPQTTPTTIVVTKQGRIAARVNGSILFTQLRSLVDDVLAGHG